MTVHEAAGHLEAVVVECMLTEASALYESPDSPDRFRIVVQNVSADNPDTAVSITRLEL